MPTSEGRCDASTVLLLATLTSLNIDIHIAILQVSASSTSSMAGGMCSQPGMNTIFKVVSSMFLAVQAAAKSMLVTVGFRILDSPRSSRRANRSSQTMSSAQEQVLLHILKL